MKAIQTSYKGYKFRSRLEARWAVFFDALGLDWQYEVEGFDLGGVYYLPDFKIISRDGDIFWYEVKRKGVTDDTKFTLFKESLPGWDYDVSIGSYSFDPEKHHHYATLLSGDPVDFLLNNVVDDLVYLFNKTGVCPRCGRISDELYVSGGYTDDDDFSITCFPCDMRTPSSSGNDKEQGIFKSYHIIPMLEPWKGDLRMNHLAYIGHLSFIKRCAISARAARFEHGETPHDRKPLPLNDEWDASI